VHLSDKTEQIIGQLFDAVTDLQKRVEIIEKWIVGQIKFKSDGDPNDALP